MAVENLSGRRCLITGAAGRIGRATALAAGAKGAELFLTDIEAEGLESTAAAVSRAGCRVMFVGTADLSDHQEVVSLAEAIHGEHGSMEVVMNVAGVATLGTIERLQHSEWRRTIDVNLVGPVSVLECFLPPMIEAGWGGHVVNVSAAAGLLGLPRHAADSAGGFGLRGVSEVLRFELRRHGIGVSLVCPGAVRARRAAGPERVAAKIVEGIERNRFMVFTSTDVRLAYWLQRRLSLPYELMMRRLNDRADAEGGR